jgi:biopolymer transport protein ExbB
MKKVISLIALTAMFTFSGNFTYAQDEVVESEEATEVVEEVVETPAAPEAPAEESATTAKIEDDSLSITQQIKVKFVEGGPVFMSFVLAALIFGLALCVERIIYLNMATTNTKKLLADVENALNSGGVDAAKEVCRNTRGPVAAIFYQGLDRANQGVEQAEKAVVSYGSVQMGLLEKGLSWIALFIALAPMLGFMGTVIGMIDAFGTIEAKGDVNAADVASGIKIALITTVSGLIVAMILQIFYNYIVAKVDSLVNQMEDSSISLVDMLVKHEAKKA